MDMEQADRRREPRFPIEAGATVEVKRQGVVARATTVDISGCGVLLKFEDSGQLTVGDQVVCEFDLMQDHGASLPCWGVGNVVRLSGELVAIDLKAGGFSPIEHNPHC